MHVSTYMGPQVIILTQIAIVTTTFQDTIIYILYYSFLSLFQNLTCQGDKVNVSIVCDDDFFLKGDVCRPRCSSWVMFSWSAETVSLSVIGVSTLIGILSTIIVIILSLVLFRNM